MTEEQYKNEGLWGMLTSVDLSDCNSETIRNADAIKEFVTELCDKIGVKPFGECKVVHFADHNDDVAGFSMVQLIETSLISAHFANKTNAIYLDVFSCKYYDPKIVEEFTKEFFEGSNLNLTITPRKAPSS